MNVSAADQRWFSATVMPAESRGRSTRLVVLIVVVAYLVSGLVGHDPWKQDETYVASIIHHIYESEDWVVPVSAGQSFMEKPPLYFVVAEETADLLERWLPMHDGARLSNLLWMAVAVGCVAAAARLAWPANREADLAAVLTLLSSLGLVLHAHSLVVDVALLAGFAAGLLGLCLFLRQPVLGGALFGTGVGIAFLAKGLLGPGCLGLSALVLTLLFEPWRSRRVLKAMGVGTLAALPWLIVWPVALYERAPVLLADWFWQENVGRFLGSAHRGAGPESWYYFKTVPLFAFPTLPFALWSAWTQRHRWRDEPTLQICLVLSIVTFAILSVARSMRALYLLPVLLPLSLLAAAGMEEVPLGWQRLSSRTAFAVYSLIAIAIWALYLMGALGAIPNWLPIEGLLPRSPVPQPGYLALTVAAVVSLAWIASIFWNRDGLVAIRHWAFGLTLVWVLSATLLLPWINEAKSYRAMFDDMEGYLPESYNCVMSYRLGESEAAMLEYEGGITALPAEQYPEADCQLIWLQGALPRSAWSLASNWRLLWSGHRPGDNKELHRLFAR